MSSTQWSTVGLDPNWVATRLALAIPNRGVPTATFEDFLGTGQMSRNARFSLDWSDGDGPASVVVKVPSSDDNTRQYGFEHGPYPTEHHFYRSVAAKVDVASAGSLGLYFDGDGQDFALLLEDLVGHFQGDQFTEPDSDQLDLAIEQAVALQAPSWERSGEEPFARLTGDQQARQERAARTKTMLQAFLPTVLERLGDGLEGGIAELLEQFAAISETWALHQSKPVTLVHGDFRPDNFMFGTADAERPLVIVDWQTLRLGRGATDVAYLLGGALEPVRRADIEREMVETYRNRLSAVGVDYSVEQCLLDYALASFHGMAVAVAATLMADTTERGDALFTLMLNRHGRHALDWDALELANSLQ